LWNELLVMLALLYIHFPHSRKGCKETRTLVPSHSTPPLLRAEHPYLNQKASHDQVRHPKRGGRRAEPRYLSNPGLPVSPCAVFQKNRLPDCVAVASGLELAPSTGHLIPTRSIGAATVAASHCSLKRSSSARHPQAQGGVWIGPPMRKSGESVASSNRESCG
jgi:hypothetical protein